VSKAVRAWSWPLNSM